MSKNSSQEPYSFLQWFFELLAVDKARIIGLLLSASVFTYNVSLAVIKAFNDYKAKRREKRTKNTPQK